MVTRTKKKDTRTTDQFRPNTYSWIAIEDAVDGIAPTDPWWSGQSVFKWLTDWDQPTGPFFHVVYGDTSPLSVGDYLTTPASRKKLGMMAKRVPLEDQTARGLARLLYDPHAVYVTTERPSNWTSDRYVWYEVVPEGRLWSDPEVPARDAWCCDRALIVDVHQYTRQDLNRERNINE